MGPSPLADPPESIPLDVESYRALYEYCPDGVMFTSPDGRIHAANPAACEMLVLSEAEICQRGRQGLIDEDDRRWPALVKTRDRTGRVRGVARMRRGDGRLIEVEMSARVFIDRHGEKRTCTIVRDVTDRIALERRLVSMAEELEELTLTDELTGLRNRRGLLTLGWQLAEIADRQDAALQVLFVDVDNLKVINDRLGHRSGDAALQAVADALRQSFRRADVVGRISGDEFAAVAVDLTVADRRAVEERLWQRLRRPETALGVGRPVEVSLGWVDRRPGDGRPVEDLLADADRAMYRVKRAKRGLA